jgi:ribosomal protein S18 acetylase RimI-like enzyme
MLVETDYGFCEYAFEEGYTHIYNLFVFSEYRRNGKARELLKLAIEEIRKSGYDGEIQIVAEPQEKSIDKEKLIEFYKSMGLQVFQYYG